METRLGNPTGVALLQVIEVTVHSRAGDRPPDCCGQRRGRGRPGGANSSTILPHRDLVRILRRATVEGGTSTLQPWNVPQGQEVLWLFPNVLGGKKKKGGANREEKTQKYYPLQPSRSLGALRAWHSWGRVRGQNRWTLPLLCGPPAGFAGSLSWPYFSVGSQHA